MPWIWNHRKVGATGYGGWDVNSARAVATLTTDPPLRPVFRSFDRSWVFVFSSQTFNSEATVLVSGINLKS